MSEPQPRPTNKRASIRLSAKPRTKVTCRKGTLDLGPNLAKSLLDISESGVRLLTDVALDDGQDVTVSLEAPTHQRPIARQGRVVWSVATVDGSWCIGIQLEKYIAYADVQQLAVNRLS